MFFRRALLPIAIASLCWSCANEETAQRPPNVVVILADDMGIGDVGVYNSESKIPTPNLDAFAASGMRFTDAHSPSAVCTPTRYGILTGRYSWRTRLKQGVLWGEDVSLIDVDRLTVADMMHNSGYATGAFGKWHLGLGAAPEGVDPAEAKTNWNEPLVPGPLEHGFDEFFGIPASLDMEPICSSAIARLSSSPRSTLKPANAPALAAAASGAPGPSRRISITPTCSAASSTKLLLSSNVGRQQPTASHSSSICR